MTKYYNPDQKFTKCFWCGRSKHRRNKEHFTEHALLQHIRDAHSPSKAVAPKQEPDDDMPDGAYFAMQAEMAEYGIADDEYMEAQ